MTFHTFRTGFLVLLLGLVGSPLAAQTLTPAQLTTLRNHIQASGDLNTLPDDADGDAEIARLLNQTASPDFFVWRTRLSSMDAQGGAGFDWTRVDNMTVGQARIWEYLTRFSTINPSLAAVRAGINAAFSGTVPGDVATRLAVFQEAQRRATRFEKLYAVGSGTSTTNAGVGPATLVLEGAVTGAVINSARQ